MLDGERAVERRSEDLLVGAREEVRKDAIRQRCEAHPHVGHGRADLARRGLRPLDALGRLEGPLSEHRARDVEHDEGLGVGSHCSIARPCEYRLRRGQAKQHTAEDEPEQRGEQDARRLGDAERRSRAARAATDPTQGDERHDEAKCEEGSEWREDRQRHRQARGSVAAAGVACTRTARAASAR